MPDNTLESILELLNPFTHPGLPISKSSLICLNEDGRKEFYDFLISPDKKHPEGIHRPKCPIKDMAHASAARYPYKKAMADYIEQWGYKFGTPCSITPSLLEATANYLETRFS